LPGDTVLLRSGYHGYIDYSNGNNSDYITIAAQPGHTPELGSIHLTDASKWIFRGLSISPELTPGAYTPVGQIFDIGGTSQFITIENCTIYSVWDSSGWTAGDWGSLTGNGIYIDDTSVSNITIRQNHVKNVAHGILVTVRNSLMEHNTVENFCADGLRGGATDQTWQYNTVKNSYDVDDTHRDGIQIYTGSRGAASGTVIRGNIFISTEDLSRPLNADGELQGISLFQAEANHEITIENNVVITEHGNGIIVDSAVDSKIVNNIVFSRFGANAGEIDLRTSPQNTIVRNNIAYSLPANGSGVTSDHNIDLGSFNPDIFFVDWRNFNLRPKAGSPAIDAGSSSDAPNIDIEGAARPQGSAYDIGAYEYGSGSGGNLSPNANAGTDQTVSDSDQNGSQQVTLNGSGSSDSDGTITSYVWTEGGSQIATGVTANATLTVGTHTITLTVTDNDGATDTDTVTITVQSSSAGGSISLEAEGAVLSGAVAANNKAGFTGTGFVDYTHARNDYIEWTVNASAAGQYELQFRYGLASGNRPLRISINGTVVVNSKSFPATGSWTTWRTVSTIQTLNAGANTVRATAIGSSGANVDCLNVIGP
jgi:hypothetical protein